jgi:16S rRNA (cytosine967-C5)-methyltransferase
MRSQVPCDSGEYAAVRRQTPREIAARVLQRHESSGQFAEALLDHELGLAHLGHRDRGLTQELVYGAVRWQATLDWLIAKKADRRPPDGPVRALLRLGLYQLFWLSRIPDHAAVFETVELARELAGEGVAAFVNAVLRGFLREFEPTRVALEALKRSDPATGWSHPAWLIRAWTQRWGDAAVQRLLEWNNSPAPTYVRINTLQTRPEKVIEKWRMTENVDYDFGRWDWIPENTVFKLKQHPPLERLETFRRGAFYVQDPSTLLAVKLLDPQAGDRVLDACAAPGGKTTYIAQVLEDDGEVVAEDVSSSRLEQIRENCRRLAVVSVETRLATSATQVLPEFDRALVDAPCSNTGVLRRRLDARWRTRPEDLRQLAAQQLELLTRTASRIRPGGTLVYSTCSIEPEENSAVVEQFLAVRPEYRLVSQRTLLPHQDGVDGAFAARLDQNLGVTPAPTAR